MNYKSWKYLIPSSILIVITLAFLLDSKTDPVDQMESDKKLPDFLAEDIFGNIISNKDLKGQIVYIQFVNPMYNEQIELLRSFYSEFGVLAKCVVITKDRDRFVDTFGFLDPNMTIIEKNYDELKKKLKSPDCCQNFYLFDSNGMLVLSNMNYTEYDKFLRPSMLKLKEPKSISIQQLIQKNIIPNLENQIMAFMKNYKSNYYIISMNYEICKGCMSGEIIRKLNEFYKENSSILTITSIIPNTYNSIDVDNLIKLYRLKYPVLIADERISSKWTYLISEYGEREIAHFIIIFNSKGKILKILHTIEEIRILFSSHLYELIGRHNIDE